MKINVKSKILILGSILLFPLTSSVATANPAYIDNDGNITISGEVDQTHNDEFSLIVNDENVDVSMEEIDEETIEYLIDSGIVKEGTYITVYGEIGDGVGTDKVINAQSIQLYSQ